MKYLRLTFNLWSGPHTLLLNVILTIQMSIDVQFEESAAAHNKADLKDRKECTTNLTVITKL